MIEELGLPFYEQIQEILQRLDITQDAAETHGMLCGFLCSDPDLREADWNHHALNLRESGSALSAEEQEILGDLFRVTARQLRDELFGFELLLPDEEESLDVRSAALSHWCHGFLYALTLNEVTVNDNHSQECHEALYDLAEIAQTTGYYQRLTDDDEEDYCEIVEYIRVAVITIWCELFEATLAAGQPVSETLH